MLDTCKKPARKKQPFAPVVHLSNCFISLKKPSETILKCNFKTIHTLIDDGLDNPNLVSHKFTVFKLLQGISMGHFCWMLGWCVEKSVEKCVGKCENWQQQCTPRYKRKTTELFRKGVRVGVQWVATQSFCNCVPELIVNLRLFSDAHDNFYLCLLRKQN